MALAQMLPLGTLGKRERARICNLDGPDLSVHRLREVGIREGAMVEMIRPGAPCVVRIDNRSMSLRCVDCLVMVEREDCPHGACP